MATESDDGLWDLSQLDNLNDDSILQILKTRYNKDKIYVSVNENRIYIIKIVRRHFLRVLNYLTFLYNVNVQGNT